MSAYRFAVDFTIIVLTKRAKTFRDQIVAVVVVTLLVMTASIAFYSPKPLVMLFGIAPLCGLFLLLDAKLLANWRVALLAVWARRDIDLSAFSHAIRAVPQLPEATLTSMLSLLGAAQDEKIEAPASVQTRQAASAVVQFADTLGLRQLAAKVCAAAIVTASVCWAAAAQAWQPLGLVAVVLLLPLALRWLKASLQRQSRAAVLAAREHPDFDSDTFRLLIQQFPLGGQQLAGDGWIDAA
jgi:hypothetical protein